MECWCHCYFAWGFGRTMASGRPGLWDTSLSLVPAWRNDMCKEDKSSDDIQWHPMTSCRCSPKKIDITSGVRRPSQYNSIIKDTFFAHCHIAQLKTTKCLTPYGFGPSNPKLIRLDLPSLSDPRYECTNFLKTLCIQWFVYPIPVFVA